MLLKKKKIPQYIIDDIDISSDSYKEISGEEDFIEENFEEKNSDEEISDEKNLKNANITNKKFFIIFFLYI